MIIGVVEDVVLMYDRDSKRARGFGFVSFTSEEPVIKLCQMHFVELDGKTVEIKVAQPKAPIGYPRNQRYWITINCFVYMYIYVFIFIYIKCLSLCLCVCVLLFIYHLLINISLSIYPYENVVPACMIAILTLPHPVRYTHRGRGRSSMGGMYGHQQQLQQQSRAPPGSAPYMHASYHSSNMSK